MRLAVTGANGRLGGAVVRLAARQPNWDAIAWTRTDVDLDAPGTIGPALERDRPDVVAHCAAWTDVDGCAREPELAMRRNGEATGVIARACAERGIGFLAVSTNEVFDGRRLDGQPYRVGDPPAPGNPYGRAKHRGELLAAEAFAGVQAPLWIVRTSWLFGPPGADFPIKILSAAHAAQEAGRALRLVADEVASPTAARDLAAGVVDLVDHPASSGVHHVINAGHASRADWARRILAAVGLAVPTENVSLDDWPRASTPPRWGVL